MNKEWFSVIWGAWFLLFAGIFILGGCSSSECLQRWQSTSHNLPNTVGEKDCPMEYHKSRRYCIEGATVVILRGSPYELGYARGVLLREEIQAWAQEALLETEKQQAARNLDQKRIKETLSALEAAIPQEFRRELEGLTAASGVDYPTLLKLNVWSNVDGGCTSVAVLGSHGRLLRSRNYDWVPIRILLPQILAVYEPDNGYAFMSVHAPGIIGVATGMNEKGMTFGSHSLPGIWRSDKGTPSAMLNRLALQFSATLDDVERILTVNPRGTPKLWLVTTQETARIYEFDSVDVHRIDLEGESLVLTNHGRQMNVREPSPSSLGRFDAATRLIRGYNGNMNVKNLIELSSNQDIFFYGQNSGFTNLHSVVFVPSSLESWVALDSPPAVKGRWVKFALKPILMENGGSP